MKNIIGIHGKKRSGKDTCANIIRKYKGYDIYSLANPIKEAISYATKFTMDEMNGITVDRENTFIEVNLEQLKNMLYYLNKNYEPLTLCELIDAIQIINNIKDYKFSIRKLMQFIGTDLMVSVRKTYWLSNLSNLNKSIIISDIRQEHEIEFIRKYGEMIFINKNTNMVDDHVTERGLIPIDGEIIIDNNGTISDLEQQIKNILKV